MASSQCERDAAKTSTTLVRCAARVASASAVRGGETRDAAELGEETLTHVESNHVHSIYTKRCEAFSLDKYCTAMRDRSSKT
jgi:hypothetical protein